MSTKKYDALVLIGRFQPFHQAHLEIIKRATVLTDKLIVIIGSAKQPRTFKNPFSADERAQMIRAATSGLAMTINIEANTDSIYSDQAWAVRVQSLVAKHTKSGDKIGVIGHKKDASSEYLSFFPQWELEEVPLFEPLDASSIRNLYFKHDCNLNFIKSVVPQTTYEFLRSFKDSTDFDNVVCEREFLIEHAKQYSSLRYPPIFSTADAVVVQSGHILLIKRRAVPGKGLWALPGGYVNANTDRSVQDAAIRELREETGLKVPTPVLVGNIKASRVFDAIDRSPRGRIITHCFLIQLPDGPLPKVKGLDDAEKAVWTPLAELDSSMMFEDHYQIITRLIGGL